MLRLLSSSLSKSQGGLPGLGLPCLPFAASALWNPAATPAAGTVQQARTYRAGLQSWPQPASQADLPKVRELLKRDTAQLTAVFSPHGFALLPIGRGSLIARPSQLPDLDKEIDEDMEEKEQEEPSIQAIGIKTWRRLKMKKHKIKKRRQASRHKTRKV